MATVKDFVKHCKTLISRAKIEEAINALLAYLEDNNNSKHYNNVNLLSGTYYHNKDMIMKDLTTDSQYTKVSNGLLDILDQLNQKPDKPIPYALCLAIQKETKWAFEESMPTIVEKSEPIVPLSPQAKKDLEYHQLMEVYIQQKAELSTNSTAEERKTFIETQRKLREVLEEDMKKVVLMNPTWKKTWAMELAQEIYATEILSVVLIQEIRKVIDNKDDYKWYDRDIIVSALILSSLQEKCFQLEKVELLIDFLNQYEENVWQRALIGIMLTLGKNPNRWNSKKSFLERRLLELKKREHIQDALTTIYFILNFNLQEEVLFIPNLFKHDFFTQNPLHCFLPFHAESEILITALDSADAETDIEDLKGHILNIPYMNAMKHFFTLGIPNKSTYLEKLTGNEATTFYNKMKRPYELNPFYNILCEFFMFYQHYPLQNSTILDKNFTLPTKIQDLVLGRIEKLECEVYSFLKKENYKAAINSLTQILSLEPNNIWAKKQLANCYVNIRNYKEALILCKQVEKTKPEDVSNLKAIGDIFFKQKKYKEALVYFEKVKSLQPNEVENLINIADCWNKFKDFEKAIELYTHIENNYPPNARNFNNKAGCYFKMEQYEKTLPYILKANELEPNNIDHLNNLISAYLQINDIVNTLFYLEKAKVIDAKNEIILSLYGKVYWQGKKNLAEAKQYLQQALQLEKYSSTYGVLAHIYFCEGNRKLAFQYYQKSLELFDTLEEYQEAIKDDMKYMEQYEVDMEDYKALQEEIIVWWETEGKKKKKSVNTKGSGGFKKK